MYELFYVQIISTLLQPLIFVDRYTTGWFLNIKKRHILLGFVAIGFTAIFIPIFTYLYFAADLNSASILMNKNDEGVVLLDQDNNPFFTFYQGKYKNFVPLSQISAYTQQAVIAIEDHEFYQHRGFSIKGILRSLVQNIQNRELKYGGSTITQQLIKNSLLSSRKDFIRKYQEIVLATEMERRFVKEDILEMYLNSVYFGEGAFGVEEAARIYFDKSAKDLDVAQSAMLAGLLKSPSTLSPKSGDLDKAKVRQTVVLEKMAQQNFITEEQREDAEREPLDVNNDSSKVKYLAPHFALMVRDELIDKFGEENVINSGFKVKTTINLDWQKYAEKVVAEQVRKLATDNVTNGAVVVIDPKSGEIRALVGSKDWYNNSFGRMNIALYPRSPGSAFKPIIYLAALEQGIITPATILKDEPTTFKNGNGNVRLASYSPQNYDSRFRGPVTVRQALSNSLNVPSVEVMSKLGLENGLEMAKRLGITTLEDPSNYGLSLVLGTGEVPLVELTNVYATLANNGYKNDYTTILEVRDKYDRLVYRHLADPGLVVDPKYAFLISSILSDNQARVEQFGSLLNISRPAAVKTGTSQSYRDSWTVGYTPSLAVGVWVGNNNNRKMSNIAGSIGAAPIWKALMEYILDGSPIERFDPPLGVTSKYICPWNGLLVKESTPSARVEYFVAGTEPKLFCNTKPQEPQEKK